MNPTQPPQMPATGAPAAGQMNMDGSTVPADPEQQMGLLLEMTLSHHASDLHLSVGVKPMLRVDGILHAVEEHPIVTPERVEGLIQAVITKEQFERLQENKELDCSIAYADKARFRVNMYFQKSFMGATLRVIPSKINSYEELDLPKQLAGYAKLSQGLVLFAGPTGHGKSTTQAAIIDDINRSRGEHIITIEDPIEYVHTHKRSIITQREVHQDTESFPNALRAVLREDPDVVMVGEMRDYETMGAAMSIAETGHLVFATVHTNDAAQTVDRIIDSFPGHQQNQMRAQLASVLTGVVSQRLLPKIGGGRVPVVEVMVNSQAVKSLIREAKTHQIPGVIQTSSDEGMMSMERSLAERVQQGLVRYEDATTYAGDLNTLNKLVNKA